MVQVLAASEILTGKRKKKRTRKLKTDTPWLFSESGREEIPMEVFLKDWQEEYEIRR